MRDPGTAIVLSENERIRLTGHALGILTRMAKENEDVARPLLARAELPEHVVRQVYNHVGQGLRAWIETHFGSIGADATQTVDDIILEFADSSRAFMPPESVTEAADRYAALGMLNMQLMMEILQKGQIASFIGFFSRYTGLPARRVHDFLRQSCPKGMAIACRAFGVQKSDFSRIYLMTQKMRSHTRAVNHKDMIEVLAYFDKIRPEMAQKIVSRSTVH